MVDEELYRRLCDEMREGVMVCDLVRDDKGAAVDYCVEHANRAAEAIFGTRLTGRLASEAFGIQEAPYLEAYAAVVETQASRKFETALASEDKTLNVSVFPVEQRRFAVIVEDVTEWRHLELQYLQAQKLEAVGRLAGGIAHDFNNLLTAILGYADLLLEQLADSPIGDDLREIQEAAHRAARLTRHLLAFSRKQVMRVTTLDVNRLVADVHEMSRRALGEDVDFRMACAPDLWPVRADQTQLEQVLMNLIVNARDALPHGGTIEVSTSNVTLDASYAAHHAPVVPGDYVLMAVTDDGVGMDEATKRRIFEPFFTTKEPGKGTGLGLATVYGIVKQLGGFIWVYSEVGQGTTMKIYFPAARAAQVFAGDTLEKQGTAVPIGREPILLVEDDREVRSFAANALRRHGYRVIAASSGEEAITLFRQAEPKPALLLTDVVLPGMRGSEVANVLRAESPNLQVLFTSGYTEDSIVHRGILDEHVDLLEKPFTATALLTRIRAKLADPSDA